MEMNSEIKILNIILIVVCILNILIGTFVMGHLNGLEYNKNLLKNEIKYCDSKENIAVLFINEHDKVTAGCSELGVYTNRVCEHIMLSSTGKFKCCNLINTTWVCN